MVLRSLAALLVYAGVGSAGEPLKVFVLVGQSNMQGHARVETLAGMALDPATAPLHRELVGADGAPVVLDDVRVSFLTAGRDGDVVRGGPLTAGFGAGAPGEKLGPEFAFGVTMRERLGEPFLIVKAAWGGKSLHTDFRPPSAGPRTLSDAEANRLRDRGEDPAAAQEKLTADSGAYYRKTLAHVRAALADAAALHPAYDPAAGCELAGLVWFQGWNDMVAGDQYPGRGGPGGYAEYSRLLATFVRDVRRDLDAPELPVVIGVLGVGGPTAEYDSDRYKVVHQNFRDAMAAPAALPEFAGSVAAVRTERFWDREVAALAARRRGLGAGNKQIDADRKAGALTREQADAAKRALLDEAFTPAELARLEASVSNQEYHYLGSAGVLCRIGEAFAEANADLLAPPTDGRRGD